LERRDDYFLQDKLSGGCLNQTLKVLQVFGHASVTHNAVVSFPEKPMDRRADKAIIPMEDLSENDLWPKQSPAGPSPSVRASLPKLPLAYRGEYSILISETDMSKPNDLVQGTLDLLLLKILALEPLHGWAISLRLKSISGDVLQVSDGSLYPALHKLEQEGWITAEWKQTENNRRAKFYSLTRLGRQHLEKEAANWTRLSAAISHVVRLEEA
jgi:PadR family transcriptional regulator PadR